MPSSISSGRRLGVPAAADHEDQRAAQEPAAFGLRRTDGEDVRRRETPAAAILAGVPKPWDEAGIAAALAAIADAYRYAWFSVHTMPSTDDGHSGTRLVMSNWTAGFVRSYDQLGLARYSPVVRALKADPMPFAWDFETLYGGGDDAVPGARLLADNGFLAGAFFPVHGLTSFSGAVAFAGERSDLSEAESGELHLAAFAVFGMLAACRFEENRRNNPLSQRERDCLKLAMLGKTSSEIGIILSLSESTVSQYLTAATRKMDASNRTHAVALAAQLGYLS